jgi:CBS domain-containing protein
MNLRARDLMQKDVLTLGPDTPLINAHRFFVEEEIHGAPVVEDDGRVVGVVSTLDLLRAVEEEHDGGASAPSYFRDALELSSSAWSNLAQVFQDRITELRVRDVMSSEVVAVGPDSTAAEIRERELTASLAARARSRFPLGPDGDRVEPGSPRA